MVWKVKGLAALLICLSVLAAVVVGGFLGETAATASGEVNEIWRIGLVNQSTAEFGTGGSGALTYTIPGDWKTRTNWSGFQGRWETMDGNNISYTINYELNSVPASAYLELAVWDADSKTSSYRVTVNGTDLQVLWIGGRNNIDRSFDSVIHVYWPIPTDLLNTGANTIQIWNPVQNTGNSIDPGGSVGTIKLDYLRLVEGEKNAYKPILRGAGIWWMSRDMNEHGMLHDYGGARGYEGAVHYAMEGFERDLPLLKRLGITYVYTSIFWAAMERDFKGDWNQETIDYYYNTFETLRDEGIYVAANIQYTPKWASANPTHDNYESFPPADMQDWDDFILRVAQEFGDVVDHYIILNEVDGPHFWEGTYADYLEMYTRAHDILTTHDTVDANGDGVAARVAPAGLEKEDGVGPLPQNRYSRGLYNDAGHLFDVWHYHDYNWGNIQRNVNMYNLGQKMLFIDEWGSGYWTDETQRAYEQESGGWRATYPTDPPYAHENYDELRMLQLFQQGYFHVDGFAVFNFYADIHRNVDWQEDYGKHQYDYGNGLVEIMPDENGDPGWTYFHPGGATFQHFNWLYRYDGPLYPVHAEHADEARVMIGAVADLETGNVQVIATNIDYDDYDGGQDYTVTIRVPLADGQYTLNVYDPYFLDYTTTVSVTNGLFTITETLGTPNHTRTIRFEFVDAYQAPEPPEPGDPPAAPTGLTAAAVSSSRIDLNWDDNTESDLDSYNVYRDTSPGVTASPANLVAAGISSSEYNDTGLDPETTYYYVVTAVNTSSQESDASNEASATTQQATGDPVIHVHAMLTTDAGGAPKSVYSPGETVYWRVQVADENNSAVGGASVTTRVLRPNGSTWTTQTQSTGSDGWALFSRSLPGAGPIFGTWLIEVTNVSKSGHTYDPAENVVTWINFTVE